MSPRPLIYTIGHSTHPLEEFVAILRAYNIEQLVDIRSVPRSRHNPQFEQTELDQSLPAAGIFYCHLKQLGGLRRPVKDSVNTGWRDTSFRGYADYMQTDAFTQAIQELMNYATDQTTTIMCAEAVPWRCHRSLVSDALLVRGIDVIDILSPTSSKPHKLTPWAQVAAERITYPR
jgi:uncharacterized protein (DUF488 family)